MSATVFEIGSSIDIVGKQRTDGSLHCNNCKASINERSAVYSCVVCLNGETPSLRDLLCGRCRDRHRKGHGK